MSHEEALLSNNGNKVVSVFIDLASFHQSFTLHKHLRSVEGNNVTLELPLCWEGDIRQRAGKEYDEELSNELWFLAWDQGAIRPDHLIFAVHDADVDCRECVEWMCS